MRYNNIAGFKSIDEFVNHKLSCLAQTDKSMRSLYGLMFSEKNNVFCESTDGYRVKKVTYGQSEECIEGLAGSLSAMLKEKPVGTIVGLYLENCREWLELFWAILKSGYKPLLVNTRIDDETLEDVYSQYGVGAVISRNKNYKVQNIHVEDIYNCDKKDQVKQEVFQDEVFLMSSNTSSHLKICSYSGEKFYYQIKDSSEVIKTSKSVKKHYKGELKLLAFLPLYHIFGFVAMYIWFCFFSRTLVFLKDYSPKTIVNTIRKHNVTHIFAVPIFWEKIYDTAIRTIQDQGEKTYKKFLRGMKISDSLGNSKVLHHIFSKIAFKRIRDGMFGESISFLINGGGYVSYDVMRFINGIGYHLTNGYGMTELGITSVELTDIPNERNKCSVGKPFSSLEYKINDGSELLVKGKSIADKVYSDGQPTESKGEWFNTHDLFELKNNKYYINGRKDDLIICSNGENINPNIIEPKLMFDGLKRICLVSNQNSVVLICEINKYIDSQQFEIIEKTLNERISDLNMSSMINKVVFTSSYLMGVNDFKINRNKIKEMLKNDQLTIVSRSSFVSDNTEDDELTLRIKQLFAKAIGKPVEDIRNDGHFFFDLGGTSLDYFTMITNIQTEFEVPFPSTLQTSISTVNDMVKYVREHIK